MPNWTPHIKKTLNDAIRWLTIDMISRKCQDLHAERWERRSGGVLRQKPKPSAPCVKNALITLIGQREAVGMRGARGANWFATSGHAVSPGFCGGPRLPNEYMQRNGARDWNERVLEAVRDGEEIPIPWSNITPGDATPRTPVREAPSGPMTAQELRIIENFCRIELEFDRSVNQFLERINTSNGNSLANRIPAELRPYVTMEDLDEVFIETLAKILEKARAKSETGPRTLESEFFSRLNSLADEDDG